LPLFLGLLPLLPFILAVWIGLIICAPDQQVSKISNPRCAIIRYWFNASLLLGSLLCLDLPLSRNEIIRSGCLPTSYCRSNIIR